MSIEPGEVGEIVVSGEHVLSGYLNGLGNEETKFDVAQQRWHRTGDTGYLNSQGRLWLMGRWAALIKDHRGYLYPFAIESAAIHFSGVIGTALIQHNEQRLLVVQEESKGRCRVDELRKVLKWAMLDEIRTVNRIPMDKRHTRR